MRKVLIALAIVLAPATGIAQEAEECSIGTVGNNNQIVVSHPNGVAIWFSSPFWFIWNPSTGLPQAPALWDLGFCSNRDAVAVALTKAMCPDLEGTCTIVKFRNASYGTRHVGGAVLGFSHGAWYIYNPQSQG